MVEDNAINGKVWGSNPRAFARTAMFITITPTGRLAACNKPANQMKACEETVFSSWSKTGERKSINQAKKGSAKNRRSFQELLK